MAQSFIACGVYLFLSILVYYKIYHHPSHVGLQEQNRTENLNYGLVIDETTQVVTNIFGSQDSVQTSSSNRVEVTFMDAFNVTELNWLCVSYLLR